ncbi:MAG: hypothetical protein ABIN91_09300 [Mucilaginibacter sp.]|uniref:hypothetical protein n=1 Tax=Mucilaginibacter sp. TaxID=1882438 RepID=UPI0032676440
MKISGSVFILMLCCHSLLAQNIKVWNNKRCAVVLTYDDAINVDPVKQAQQTHTYTTKLMAASNWRSFLIYTNMMK